MEQQFRDEYGELRGWAARLRFWGRALTDLALSAPGEIARELRQDLGYAFRAYRKRAISSGMAILTLGFAMGAGTAVFSVANSMLLRDLPFADAESLVQTPTPSLIPGGKAAFNAWREDHRFLEDGAVYTLSEMNLGNDQGAVRTTVARTSANFFELLGVRISQGRTFAAEEDEPGRGYVALISHSLWRQAFASDPGVLGQPVRLNGREFTIVGIVPPNFDYPGGAAAWTPTAFDLALAPRRGAFSFEAIGRLKTGVSIAQAQELTEVDHDPPVPLRAQLAGPVRRAIFVLGGVVFFLWLAAWANVAQWFLARATERQPELALRAALGANRLRLVQQLSTEALGLAAAGAVLGLLIARWASQLAYAVAGPQLASQDYRLADWRVFLFAAVLAVATGLLFGVLPAWMLGRLQPAIRLAGSGRVGSDLSGGRLRKSLLALQAALTILLIAGAFGMGQTFLALIDNDLGFSKDNIVTITVSIEGSGLESAAAEQQYYHDALERLRSAPGIEAAGAVSYLPLDKRMYQSFPLKLDSGQEISRVIANAAMPGYFETMGIPVLAGRDFLPGRLERTVIVNEAFANETGLGTALIGRTMTTRWSDKPYEIVGIVPTSRLNNPAYPGSPQAFWQIDEEPPAQVSFVARTRGPANAYLASSRTAIQSVNQGIPVYHVTTMEGRFQGATAQPRFYTIALFFFGSMAALMAAIGIYGAAANAVAKRKREMGVRLALGASRGGVRTMIVRESLTPIAVGSVVGVAAALAWGRSLGSLIVDARPLDLTLCATAAAFVLLVAALAAWSATVRILRIHPADALRAE